MKSTYKQAERFMRDQHSLITRHQAVSLGLSPAAIRHYLDSGRWEKIHPGVYTTCSAAPTAERDLLAACLGAGPRSAASHRSAAWLLTLCEAPAHPVVTLPYRSRSNLRGVTVHRSRDLDPGRVLVRRGIPYTDALRTLTDLAGEMDEPELLMVTDRALANRLVTTGGLTAEIARRSAPGRRGPARLARMLSARGFVGGPEPTVLEAMAMRLFRRWGIPLLDREVKIGPDGRYRIDFLIATHLVVEVDGYAYHWSPEDKAYDDARRNRLRASGLTVLVYDWRAVRFEERRIAGEILSALRLARTSEVGATDPSAVPTA
ncbi:MAG: type IV toxin-antitoxin system AbiEi family antitoxin domain-containing protein [Acidobacteriota bacterium]|nr:type IV toxin-antitoxin system AbiEi family antitoxin domain-containing protein [Acidobacteriota bacterium]